MRHPCAALLLVALGSGTAVAADAPTIEDYLGRWNIEMLDTGDTFFTAWLKVERVDGSLRGGLVWKWGGVRGIQDIAVEDGELRFRSGGDRFSARLSDGELSGIARHGGNRTTKFRGWPAPEMCDLSGTWKVTARGDDKEAKLILEQEDGKVTGRAIDPEGIRYTLSDCRLDSSSPAEEGYVLTCESVPQGREAASAKVTCSFRGDTLTGQVVMTPPDGGEERTVEIRGKRDREWGEPIELIAESSLEGWEPRGQRDFKWEVEDGILRNNPTDDDIKSKTRVLDFLMHLEYQVEPGANSGIYLRGQYELQILGSKDIQPHGNMAVYSRLSPEANPIREPLGERWQEVDVEFVGRWLTLRLNGETIYENQYLEGPTGGAVKPKEGKPLPLLLQGDHGKIRFRNITVRKPK